MPSAQEIRKLREQTSAGMLDCKKALEECKDNFDEAVDWLRKKGIAKAASKSSRIAAEGVIAVSPNGDAMVELNCETDFVAKNEEFLGFAKALAEQVATTKPANVDEALKMPFKNGTLQEALGELSSKMGENTQLRRIALPQGEHKAIYVHSPLASNIGKIGVVVATDTKSPEIAEQVAMHIAAFSPVAVTKEGVDATLANKEKEVIKAQLEGDKKPPEILAKIVDGKMAKWFKEVALNEQGWIMDDKTNVGKVLSQANVKVTQFTRLQVAE